MKVESIAECLEHSAVLLTCIDQFKCMLMMPKRTVSLRWLFWVSTIYVLVEK